MTEEEHPVAALVRAEAEARGMNWSATPPGSLGGQWDFKIWPKGQDAPSSED